MWVRGAPIFSPHPLRLRVPVPRASAGLWKAVKPFFTDASSSVPDWKLLHTVADAQYPKFLQSWGQAFGEAQGAVDIPTLTQFLQSGHLQAAEKTLLTAWKDVGLSGQESRLDPILFNTVSQGANAAISLWPATTGTPWGGSFSLQLPEAEAFINRLGADMVREVSDVTRQGIRGIVYRGFQEGFPPDQMARQMRAMVGLTEKQLGPIERYTAKLAADGVSPEKIEELRQKLVARKIRQRTATIARTESITAAGAGQQQMWLQARDQALLNDGKTRRVWIVTPDDRLCPFCQAIPDLNPQGVTLDAPFKTPGSPVLFPAAHPNCRCAIALRIGTIAVPPIERLRAAMDPIPVLEEAEVMAHVSPRRIGGTTGAVLAQGKDSTWRVVKPYKDPAQAYAEVVANRIYESLGVDVPKSALVLRADGGLSFASEYIVTAGPMGGGVGLTKARATAILDNYVADVFLGNWDVVGLEWDNILVTPANAGKRIIRIDQGSSFLFRAQGARKAVSVLNEVSEWEGFANPTLNPAYSRVFQRAGVATPADLGKKALDQITKLNTLAQNTSNFATLFPSGAGIIPDADRDAMLLMLRTRLSKLITDVAPKLKLRPTLPRKAKVILEKIAPTSDLLPELTDAEYDKLLSNMLDGWGNSSTSNSGAILLAEASKREFQTGLSLIRNYKDFQFDDVQILRARSVVRRLWTETQTALTAQKKTKLKLLRGTRKPIDVANTIESWTTSQRTAEGFDRGPQGQIFERTVHQSNILAYEDGPGGSHLVGGEREYIIINRITEIPS